MNATKLLRQDHDEVRGLFKRLEVAKDEDRCRELFTELKQSLVVHTTIEQEIFYPEARSIRGVGELVAEGYTAHVGVACQLDDFPQGVFGKSEEFRGKLKALKDSVMHHLDEEEQQMFPKVEKGLGNDRLDDLGKRLDTRKQALLKKAPAKV